MTDLTAPFVCFEGSKQMEDIAASKGPTGTWRGYARWKQYNKDDEIAHAYRSGSGIAGLEFDQPFQWGVETCGMGTWNDHNAVYVVQFPTCNLSCGYCYADCTAQNVVEKTAVEVAADHAAWCDAQGGSRLLRISGGEPMLFQPFVREVWRASANPLWIDTNLTIKPKEVMPLAPADNVAICGCFKPGQVKAEKQLDTVQAWLDAGVQQLFLYYPADATVDHAGFEDLLECLMFRSPALPLRLTVLNIKWHYAQTGAENAPDDGTSDACYNNLRGRLRRWIAAPDQYPGNWLWLPSHQVPLR